MNPASAYKSSVKTDTEATLSVAGKLLISNSTLYDTGIL
jgi:hypothetical protein